MRSVQFGKERSMTWLKGSEKAEQKWLLVQEMASFKRHAPGDKSEQALPGRKAGETVDSCHLWSLELCSVTPMGKRLIILASGRPEHRTEICVCVWKMKYLSSQEKGEKVNLDLLDVLVEGAWVISLYRLRLWCIKIVSFESGKPHTVLLFPEWVSNITISDCSKNEAILDGKCSKSVQEKWGNKSHDRELEKIIWKITPPK